MKQRLFSRGMLSYKLFKASFAWIILISGLILYAVAYFRFSTNNLILKEILIKIADVLVIGVIIGYLSNAANFLGIFKQDLEDIIYSKKFLNNQSDIQKRWETVTEVMFKSKFKPICSDLFSLIKKTYLPDDVVSYYSDYRVITDIEWADRDKRFLIVRDSIDFDLIAENEKSITLHFRTKINVENLCDDEYYSNFSCKIDDKEVEVYEKNEVDEKRYFCQKFKVTFDGKTKYEVSQQRERKYCFEFDYDISFKARYVIKGLNITINHPEDLKVVMLSRGTAEDFKLKNINKTTKNYLYKGLILPKQGYIFALHKVMS